MNMIVFTSVDEEAGDEDEAGARLIPIGSYQLGAGVGTSPSSNPITTNGDDPEDVS